MRNGVSINVLVTLGVHSKVRGALVAKAATSALEDNGVALPCPCTNVSH